MKTQKKVICFLLVAAIMISLFPLSVITAEAATAADFSISQNGIDFIKAREGFSSTCYPDGPQSSIGYGTKCGTTTHDGGLHAITQEAAEEAMRTQIENTYAPRVRKQMSGVTMNQDQFDALVSLSYNTGGGTSIIKDSPLAMYLRGEMSETEARDAYLSYCVTSSGVVLSGLVTRRKAEADLFFSGSGDGSCTCSASYGGIYVCTTVEDNLNIRDGHGGKIIGAIPPQTRVTVTKASGVSASDWGHVTYNGVTGCVSMGYLSKVSQDENLQMHTSTDSLTLTLGDKATKSFTFWCTGYYANDYEMKISYSMTAGYVVMATSGPDEDGKYTIVVGGAKAGKDTITVKAVDKVTNEVITSAVVTIVVQEDESVELADISIVTQPKTTYTKMGNTAKVTVKAEGKDLKYQWYIKNDGSTSYSKSSVTSATYSCKMSSASKDRRIYCVITDAYGNQVQTKTVIVRMAASVTAQPKSVVVAKGENAKVTFTAAGDGLTYEWYYKDAGSSAFKKTSTFAGNTYTAEMTTARAGRQIYCKVTDKYGKTVKTDTVTLSMKATVTTQPKTSYTKLGATAKATVKAVGDGLKYQWYVKNAGASSYSKSSVTSATYSTTMRDAAKDRYVYCVVTDEHGNSVKTNTVTLRMAASVVTQPKSVVAAKGATAKMTVKAAGDGLKYEWYYKDKGATSFKKTSTFTGNTYTAEMTAARHDRQIYCKITDKYGNTVKTNTVTISMKATVTTQPKSVTVAKGATAKVSFEAVGDGLKYEWYYKDAGSSSFKKTTSFTGNTYSVEMTAARAGRQLYCKVTDKYGNTAKTNTVTIKMK